MKKVIFSLAVVALLTACGSSKVEEAPKADSAVVVTDTTVKADTAAVAVVDSTKK